MPAGWGSWREHYLQSSAYFAGRELCQCWRPEGINFFQEHVENRFYHEPTINASLAYIQVFGSLPVHGYLPVSPEGAHVLRREVYGAHEEASSEDGSVEWDWEADAPGVLEEVLGEGYADVLVFNTGLWGEVRDAGYLQRLFEAGERAVCPPSQGGVEHRTDALCLWRTTSRRFVCDESQEAVGKSAANSSAHENSRPSPVWDKYDRACPRKDWVPEDVGDEVVRREVERRQRSAGGSGWEIMDLATEDLGQVFPGAAACAARWI